MPTCFVVMGYGEKTDPFTGRKLNLDKTYKNVIKPAVIAAGYECVRADEVRHSGVIDIPMYDLLFKADLVVADLSTSNLNAAFELGVRHGLKPRSTIIIAENGFQSPFDVNHIVIRKCEHLGVDIGIDEGDRIRNELAALAQTLRQSQAVDSPVYSFLDLEPPRPKANPPSPQAAGPATAHDPESYGALFEIALDAKRKGEFELAKSILQRIYEEQTQQRPDGTRKAARPRVIQEFALATYKLVEKREAQTALAAYEEALDLLRQLDPDTTTDPETLGQWSAIHKRRAEMGERSEDERRADLDIAIEAAERGFLIRKDHYTGGNLAYLLDLRSSRTSGDDRVADRILADRVRRRVVTITGARLQALTKSSNTGDRDRDIEEEIFWNTASHATALVGLGNVSIEDAEKQIRHSVRERKLHDWMADTTLGQMRRIIELQTDKRLAQ